MQLENYISDLLYRYECVIVPDFGAFLTQSISAKIEENNNTFYPPKKTLSFNEQLKSNDGLLANYIAEIEKIPYEIATKKITSKVKSLKSYLAQGETLSFDNIGELVLSNEEKLIFNPSYNLNYLTDAFGLSQFVSPSIIRESLKEEVETLEKVIPIAITPEKRRSKPYLKYAAIAITFIALGGLVASNYYVSQIEQHNQLAQQEANTQIENRVQKATFIIDNPLPSVTLNVTKQSGNFHLVAGAFRIEENCDKKLQELQDLGYSARKIGKNRYGLHQVVYSSYDTRVEAQRALYNIRQKYDRDAWLLVKKLK
ncbi:SPOR domain-containing protein [Flavobacteriaceae bacterium AU392]|nr:SPOR domain-containing protein [Flavobacteriaceae bacterium]RKM84911.1 SPOR domain-containing protein [Flavobacteriaceae bacterium AU392]